MLREVRVAIKRYDWKYSFFIRRVRCIYFMYTALVYVYGRKRELVTEYRKGNLTEAVEIFPTV